MCSVLWQMRRYRYVFSYVRTCVSPKLFIYSQFHHKNTISETTQIKEKWEYEFVCIEFAFCTFCFIWFHFVPFDMKKDDEKNEPGDDWRQNCGKIIFLRVIKIGFLMSLKIQFVFWKCEWLCWPSWVSHIRLNQFSRLPSHLYTSTFLNNISSIILGRYIGCFPFDQKMVMHFTYCACNWI